MRPSVGMLSCVGLLALGLGACVMPDELNQDSSNPALLCGNGVVDGEEACDEGELNSDSLTNACRSDCSFAYCGDGVIDDGEECDDANGDETDACRTDCHVGWKEVSVAYYHTCGVKRDGSLYCWGINNTGQLGVGGYTWDAHVSPQRVGDSYDWVTVSSGGWHSCAVKTDGTLYCWGIIAQGQTAVEEGYELCEDMFEHPTACKTTPTQESSLSTNWRSVSVGRTHSCGIKTDNSLYCWGSNNDSELGSGTYRDSAVPLKVGDSNDWSSVTLGDAYTCGIKLDKSLYCWGDTSDGQLGLGSEYYPPDIRQVLTPLRVGDDNDWESVSAGEYRACALKTDSSMYCWGGVIYARTQKKPMREPTAANDWKFVQAGYGTLRAIKQDGTLYSMGGNGYGQIGDGTKEASEEFVQESTGATNWNNVDGGGSFETTVSCGVRDDGGLYCWGGSLYGLLGDGIMPTFKGHERLEPHGPIW